MAKAGQETLEVGRGGLRLPATEFESDGGMHPVHFVDFFRSVFKLNLLKSVQWGYLPPHNNPNKDAAEHIVVPASADKPLVVLGYQFFHSDHQYRGGDEYLRVLLPPERTDEFQEHISIHYHFRDPGMAGNRAQVTLDYEGSKTGLTLLDLPRDEFFTYRPEDLAQFSRLGGAVRNFVELVS